MHASCTRTTTSPPCTHLRRPQVELEDPVENIGAKLVRQAAARTNDTAGDGTTTATVLSAAFIAEGMKIVAAGGWLQEGIGWGTGAADGVGGGQRGPPAAVGGPPAAGRQGTLP